MTKTEYIAAIGADLTAANALCAELRTLRNFKKIAKTIPDADKMVAFDVMDKAITSKEGELQKLRSALGKNRRIVKKLEEIEAIVHPCGLGNSKARDISACMKQLRDQYDGQVPEDFDALLALPGVGRKSANLIMGDVFGKPAIVTDTHCIRLCNRIGLVDGIREPKKVEMALWKIVPPEEGSDLCHRFVMHGREICTARTKPYCDKCCLADICKKEL